MNLENIKEIAKNLGISPGKKKKAELIRSIQTTEANEPCFASGKASSCGQSDCLWLSSCN